MSIPPGEIDTLRTAISSRMDNPCPVLLMHVSTEHVRGDVRLRAEAPTGMELGQDKIGRDMRLR